MSNTGIVGGKHFKRQEEVITLERNFLDEDKYLAPSKVGGAFPLSTVFIAGAPVNLGKSQIVQNSVIICSEASLNNFNEEEINEN